ncbi:hypothetical protein GQ53DRAFT_760742 [Thozetella sp. PMI_491]|nr:hypothetical protein GQ53DRAFT_760742 [Thozetella sp. PMI_491]
MALGGRHLCKGLLRALPGPGVSSPVGGRSKRERMMLGTFIAKPILWNTFRIAYGEQEQGAFVSAVAKPKRKAKWLDDLEGREHNQLHRCEVGKIAKHLGGEVPLFMGIEWFHKAIMRTNLFSVALVALLAAPSLAAPVDAQAAKEKKAVDPLYSDGDLGFYPLRALAVKEKQKKAVDPLYSDGDLGFYPLRALAVKEKEKKKRAVDPLYSDGDLGFYPLRALAVKEKEKKSVEPLAVKEKEKKAVDPLYSNGDLGFYPLRALVVKEKEKKREE